ncbi:MAG: uracil-DNA glycosylase [Planctomycetota bacterium]|nr:uracil-DNA glycosylase [Planctomycetota bacterium]
MLTRLHFEQAMGIESVPPVAPPPPASGGTEEPRRPVSGRGDAAPSAAPAPAGVDLFTPAITPGAGEPDKAARWKALEAEVQSCKKCRLHAGRTNAVFGCGNKQARLLFVGEGPGFDEDQQGVPFVGRAGQLLNKIIAAMGLKREEVYICNVVKCRPPENRTPADDEVLACSRYLYEQIELVAPSVIVTLGAPATKTLLQTRQGIMSMRGKWHNFRGIPLMPTYHPAFVLRQYTQEVRSAVWEDMKQVMEKLKQS